MGLFDFLKPDKKKNVQPENIDEVFDLAAKDVAYRPLFYRTILETELYILIIPDNNIPRGKFITDGKTELKVRLLDGDRFPVFTSEAKIFDNDVIKEEIRWIAMKGKAVFDLFKEPKTILLNPYSRPSKEFLPDEIKQLRTGEFYTDDEVLHRKAGETIHLGIPAKYPTELVESLKKYCDTREEIKGAYLALIHVLKSGESPHIIIGLDLTEFKKEIFGEVSEAIRPHVAKDDFVDMINVAENDETSRNLKQKQFKVY
jgi:hypothetical protein